MSTEFFNDQWRIPSNENQNKVSNYSMDFDGTSDFINCGDSDDFSFGNGSTDSPFSISAWVNMTDATSFVTIAKDATSNREYVIRTLTDDKLYFYLLDNVNGGYIGRISSGTVTSYQGTWIHTVYTYNGNSSSSGIKIYLNGSAVDNADYQGGSYTAMSNTTTSLNIGRQEHGVGTFANGKIDQVTVFDYALSQDQVTQLGAEGYAFNFIPNDYIDLGTTTAYDTGDLSAAIWVNASSSRTGTIYPFSNSGSPSFAGFDFVIYTNNQIRIRRSTTTKSNQTGQIDIGFVSNTWQHLALTYSESTNTLKVFLNGVLKATNIGTNQTNTASKKLTIGSYEATSAFFDGELSNAAIFSSKLEDSEIATLYNNGKPGDISSLNPVAWYKLDNSELFNGAEWSIDNSKYPSVYKSSLNFSGNNQYLQVPDSNDLSFGNGTTDSPFSISAWVNPDAVEAAGIVAKYVTSGWEWLVYLTDSNKLRLQLQDNNSTGNTINLTTDAAIPINTWTHVSATYNANSESNGIDLYINGSLQSLVTEGGSGTYQAMINTTAPLQIGTWSGSFRPINGQISNVSIWDAELTPTQVSEIYNNGTPSNLSSHSATSNLISWWKLDNTTTGLQDSKGSNNASNIGTTEYIGFVNTLAGESDGMNASSLVASNINGELIANPMITSPKPIAYYQLGDQSVSTGPTSDYLVPNNSLSDYDFKFVRNNSSYTSGDSIDIRGINNILDGATSMSMTFWVYLDPAVYNNGMVFRLENANGAGSIQLRFIRYGNARGPVWQFTMSDGVNSTPSGTTSTPSRPHYYNSDFLPSPAGSNMWWNLTCTWDGSIAKIYRNGITQHSSRGEGAYIGTIANTGTAFLGGNATGATGSGLFMNGRLSNIVFWRNYSLTQSEATEVYNNGVPLDLNSFSGAAPAAWYKLDSSEIFNNTSTEWSVDNNAYPSVYESSLNFDGNNDALTIQNSSTFNLGTSFTISGWFNFASNKYQGLISFDATSGGSPRGWFLFQIDTNNDIRLFDGVNIFTLKTSYTTTNKWDSFIITYDGTDLVFYINGNQESTQAVSVDLQTNGNDGRIGNNQFASGRFFNGKISNVSFFNTALSTPNVQTLYNNGTPALDISSLNPVSWWKLDNTTTGIQDSAGSNNGTNNGATEYAGFVNSLAGKSSGMTSANLVTSDLQQTSGYSPYALDFDGIDDYLTITSTDFKGGSGTVSYSFWIKPNTYSGSSNYGYFLTDSSTGGGIAYSEGGTSIGTTPGQMYLYNMTNAGAVSTITSTFIDENVWNHIVVVFNTGNIVQFYKNGALSSTLTGITSFDATWDTIAARRYPGGLNNLINANISNIAFWNVGLTSTQVTEIYNEGVPSNLNNFSGTAPVTWWQIGSNSSYNSGAWTCLDEVGTNNAVSAGSMTNDDITNGPGYSASGLGSSSIDIKGDAPYSTANGLSENMDVLDRTLDTPIRNTHSIELDGVDDYVSFSQTFFASNYEVSYSFWVKPDTYVDTIGYFIGGGSILNGGIGYSQGYTGGSYSPGRVLYYSGAGATYTNAYLTENVWNHLVVTIGNPSTPSNRVMKVYKNGVLQSTHTGGFFGTYSQNFNTIGKAWANPVNGKMDEVSIFSSELSAPQVLSVYNNGTPGNILPLNPALWYRFESTTDNNGIIEVSDDSGNGKTGQLRNGASLSTVVP